jgi:hypothetical protein
LRHISSASLRRLSEWLIYRSRVSFRLTGKEKKKGRQNCRPFHISYDAISIPEQAGQPEHPS